MAGFVLMRVGVNLLIIENLGNFNYIFNILSLRVRTVRSETMKQAIHITVSKLAQYGRVRTVTFTQ